MKRKTAKLLVGIILATSLVLLACTMAKSNGSSQAVIWTDKPDYYPEETVTIFGSGFLPNAPVTVSVTRPDSIVNNWTVTSGLDGSFTTTYVLDGITGTYGVTATDGTNTATTTFTDAALVVDFKQYATLDDLWINSILQSSNSIYYEGMSVPQRAIFTNIPSTAGDNHFLTLSHEATKAGIHAYDFLTAWNQGNDPALPFVPWGENIGPPNTLGATAQFLDGAPGSSAYEYFVNVPNDPFISKDGSTQTRIDAYEALYGNRQIRICGNAPFTSASFTSISHDVADGADTGDSFIHYTLSWTSASTQIMIELSGHLAVSGDPAVNPIAWGVGLGASQVSGGPYHFKLDYLDTNSLGSQDNQIKGADILIVPGRIIVDKITVPAASPQSFSFSVSGPNSYSASFSLTDAAIPWDSGPLASGTYTVTETVPAGWDLTGVTLDGAAFTNGGSIVLGAGQVRYVNFTDTQRGKIIVDKITVPAASPVSFSFGTTGSGYSGFSLTDAAAPNDSGWLVPGTYTVTETVPVGWDLTAVTKNGAGFTNGADIVLGAGQIIYVNFTDTQRGKIIVDKITVPAASLQSFDFAASGPNGYSASFSLTDTATPWDSDWIKPGIGYSITETVPPGWELVNVTVDGVLSSNGASLTLNPGQTLYINFTDKELLKFLKQFTDSGAFGGYTKPTLIDPITSQAFEIKSGPRIWWEVTYTVTNKDDSGHYYILWDKWGGNLLVLDSKPTAFDVALNKVTLASGTSFVINYAGYSGYIGSGLYFTPSQGTAWATLHLGDQQQGTNPGKGKGTSNDGKSYDEDIRWEIGWLNPGETATLKIYIAPGKNPGGQLLFSSWGTNVINTGPRVRAYADDTYADNQFLYSWDFTNQLTVIVAPTVNGASIASMNFYSIILALSLLALKPLYRQRHNTSRWFRRLHRKREK